MRSRRASALPSRRASASRWLRASASPLLRRILMVNARMIEGLDDEKLILLAFQDVTAQKQAAE